MRSGDGEPTDRQAENAVIDARSVLPNGVAIDGPVELRTQLASRPAMFAQALTEKLMMYALNRELEYFDMPQVRAVVRAAAKDNYKFSSIVRGIVNTEAFRKQGAPPKAQRPDSGDSDVHHKETHFPKNAAEGRRSQPGVAAAGRHGARRHGACANRCGTEDARGLLLYSPRRDHAQHRRTARPWIRWTPSGAGADFKLSPILSPLEPYKKYVTSFGNLENAASAGSVHTLNPATWLSATRPDGTGSHPHMTPTLDQVIAKAISQDTPLPSLEVASETTVQSAAGGGGSYTTLSFRDAESPLPMEYNPRKVFLQLFGEGDTPEERAFISRQTRSILDLISDRTKKLQAQLGNNDRAVLDGYLETVREIERRAQKAGATNLSNLKIPNAPVGELEDFAEQVKLMFDLLALAFQADLTRVVSYIMVAEGTNRTYNHIGVPDAFHPDLPPRQRSGTNQQAGQDPDLARAEIFGVCREDGGNA